MRLPQEQAARLADTLADTAIDELEKFAGTQFTEEQWEGLHEMLVAEFEQAVSLLEVPS